MTWKFEGGRLETTIKLDVRRDRCRDWKKERGRKENLERDARNAIY